MQRFRSAKRGLLAITPVMVVLAALSSSGAPAGGTAAFTSAAGGRAASDPVHWWAPPHPSAIQPLNARSTNWAGYYEVGSFGSVSGAWTVPGVQASGTSQYSSTWVGLDGAAPGDGSIIQTGTEQDTTGGLSDYGAWYELYPAGTVDIREPVGPGDQMAASIVHGSGTSWLVTLADQSRGWTFALSVSYSGPAHTAEWIEEAPSLGSTQSTLADFGDLAFSALQADGSTPAQGDVQAIDLTDASDRTLAQTGPYDAAAGAFTISYVGPDPAPLSSRVTSGYDLVGGDGGVFVFAGSRGGGYYGSLPGLGVQVGDIAGMVASVDDRGYFLVGSDGGVFAFGDAPYLGSLPALGLAVSDVIGIVPTSDDQGYFVVGRDGGVFAFGDAPYLGSLPGSGITRQDIRGIAATPGGQGYWVLAADGTVYSFGDAPDLGSALGSSAPVATMSSTADGRGYWVVNRSGGVYAFGDAPYLGCLPGLDVDPATAVIGLVPTGQGQGYWLIGSDGGVYAFGDAPFVGSLPGMGVRVGDVVGAVPAA